MPSAPLRMDAGMTCHQVARQPGIYVEAKYVVCLRRLIAVLERRVYVHALETLELLGTLETAANPSLLSLLAPAIAAEQHINFCIAFICLRVAMSINLSGLFS